VVRNYRGQEVQGSESADVAKLTPDPCVAEHSSVFPTRQCTLQLLTPDP